jgi:phage tail protein X
MARIARAKKGDTLDRLTKRLFDVAEPKTGMKEAADRLAAANRHLKLRGRGRDKELKAGTFIAVPDVEGAEHTRASAPFGKAAARALLTRTQETLEAIGPRLAQAHRDATASTERTLKLADSRTLLSAAKESKALASRLETVREGSRRRLEELDRAHERRRAALERAGRTVTELLERAAGD